jgi:glycerol-1-phosphate dehydrogenase [NAD(P)+]
MSAPAGNRSIAIPRLMHITADCLSGVAPLLVSHAFDTDRVCVCSGGGPSLDLASRVVEGLRAEGIDVRHDVEPDGLLEQAAATAARIIEEDVTLVVGVGGGKVIDVAKLAAARTGVEFVSVPTTIAHDGISSPVASLIDKDGKQRSFAAALPAGIVVDVEVIGSAPPRTLRAGVGDLASNLTAVLDWRLADSLGHDRYDAFSALIAESAAFPVLGIGDLENPEARETLAKGLLMSGLAMAAAGTSRPCSGAEHLVSHSLDALLGERAALHGEQVALGSLLGAAAHDSPLLTTFRTAFGRLGLPTHPDAVGISRDELIEALVGAPAMRPERFTILTELAGDPAALEALFDRAFEPAAGVPERAGA